MEAKFKLGDRVLYIGKKRDNEPIPSKKYIIVSNGLYRDEVGSYEYNIAPSPGNDDPYNHFCIEEKYLTLAKPPMKLFA